MGKTLATLLVFTALGGGLGFVQSAWTGSSYEERFLGSRSTLAEQRKEMTREEVLEQAKGKPKAEVVGSGKFDFGMMKHGETMSHEFVVRNVGDGPLNLEMGTSSCKCTVGDLSSSVLQPGEETDIKLTWTANALTREFGQSATILTNDTDNLELKLQVQGEITYSYAIEPPTLELGSFSDSEPFSRSVHVFTYLEDSKDLKNVVWTGFETKDDVTIDVQKVDIDPREFPKHKNAFAAHEITLHFDKELPIGPLSGRVQFETDRGEDVGTLELPVTGTVLGQLELIGGQSFDSRLNLVSFGNIDSKKGASVSIFLFVQGEDRKDIIPEIVSVTPSEALKVEIGEAKEQETRIMYPIRFEVPKGAPEVYYPARGRGTQGKVVVKTKGAKSRELIINVRLVVTD